MIFGIGTDLCDVRRIEATLVRKGLRFAEKVLGPGEIRVFHARRARVESRGVRYLATRFSAKEAFSKAVGMGIHMPMTWRDCEILNEPSGKPCIRLHGELAAWFAARGLVAHVTVSDETDYVSTFCVVETADGAAPAAAAGVAAVGADPTFQREPEGG
jgi:holo-[acyl-carrier protein] synthase